MTSNALKSKPPKARTVEARLVHFQRIVLKTLDRLAAGDGRPKTLHRLRTHLRRLQAFYDMIEQPDRAEVVGDCVSRLSKLRSFHVFHRFLQDHDGPRSDLRMIRSRIRTEEKTLRRSERYHAIQESVRIHPSYPHEMVKPWSASRVALLRRGQEATLRRLLEEARADPRRKRLHALRLAVKTARHQEEWFLDQPYGRARLVKRLKKAQRVLGRYGELVQFRKLARKLRLKSHGTIVKACRRSQKPARALLPKLLRSLTDIGERPSLDIRSGPR